MISAIWDYRIDTKVLFGGVVFEGIRWERQLMETVNVNQAHRWFIGCDLTEAVPDHSIKVQANSALDRSMPCVECEVRQRS